MAYQCNGWTYDNAYLITFKVGLLRTHTLAPSILLILEATAEGFFWNLLQFGRRIPFDVLHGCETRPLEAHFQSREQPKSPGARSGEHGGWVMTEMLFSARNCCTTRDVWLGAFAPRHTSLVVVLKAFSRMEEIRIDFNIFVATPSCYLP